MKKSTELFMQTKASLISDRVRLAERVKMLDAKRKAVTAMLNKLSVDDSEYTTIYLHVYTDSIDISINMRRLESFKDARLTNMLGILEDLNPTRVSSSEYAEWVEKSFNYKFDDFVVTLSATVRSDSPTCKRVAEEVKLVEEIKYKIVCD